MDAQIIFAKSSDLTGVPFNEWLYGEADTALLLLEDSAVTNAHEQIPAIRIAPHSVSFQLHGSQDDESKQQQSLHVKKSFPKAMELQRTLSHASTHPDFSELLKLREEPARGTVINRIVRGAVGNLILDAMDALAAWEALRLLDSERQDWSERNPYIDRLIELLREPELNEFQIASEGTASMLPLLSSMAARYVA